MTARSRRMIVLVALALLILVTAVAALSGGR